ncbi:hypothetical protein RclHR1_00470028 [Rhizophagus clarus]|uniref:Serine-threonine/tyrosine-protein kinase catalytic domain-containing protein n=1 Tax=Rhizophagus clarus TaxID=94130 RepID=A0A2Z6RIE9_9GLOM|nr:hypothetical protein RclHR1_00470028 [Rhizophagus clarus]
MRPRKVTGTPLEYKNLMKQCWDADPTKRPDINYLYNKIFEMKKLYHQHDRNENNEQQQTNNNNIQILVTSNNYTSDISINSLDKNFSKSENLSEIRSVTEGHSQHNLGIPIELKMLGMKKSAQNCIKRSDIRILIKQKKNKRKKKEKKIELLEGELEVFRLSP